jgi:hypothetical protein
VTGFTGGGLDGNTNSGGSDIFLVKYNSSGTKQWTKLLGTVENDGGVGVTVDSNNNIYVTGYTKAGLDGNSDFNFGVKNNDGFLVKYNSSGVKQWTQQFGTEFVESGSDVAVDSNNNIYVTGGTNGALDGKTNSGSNDIFLIKYYDNGTKQWTQVLGTTDQDHGGSVTVDSNNNIYVTGDTAGSGGLDGNTNYGSYDIFIAKYYDNGTKQWTQVLGTEGSESGNGVTLDSNNNIYVTGYTEGGLDNNTNSGNKDFFLVKYNSSGVKQWTRQLGTSSSDLGYDVTVDSNNNIYVIGETSGEFDGNTNLGRGDIFLVKYNSDGVKQ